jgi:hypothetical protein
VKLLALLPALVLLVAACSPPVLELRGTTTGIIVEFVPAEETDGSITVFQSGERIEITVTPDTELEFPATHVQEHRLTGEPVSVDWIETDGVKEATAIADAE